MALIGCSECGKQVSDKATTCPGCGAAVKKPKKPMRMWTKVALFALVVYAATTTVGMRGRKAASTSDGAVSSASPTSSANKGMSDDVCRDTGSNIGKVYFANIKQAIDAGVLTSEMMEKGCQQAVGVQGSECVLLCKDGFRYEAKQFVK